MNNIFIAIHFIICQYCNCWRANMSNTKQLQHCGSVYMFASMRARVNMNITGSWARHCKYLFSFLPISLLYVAWVLLRIKSWSIYCTRWCTWIRNTDSSHNYLLNSKFSMSKLYANIFVINWIHIFPALFRGRIHFSDAIISHWHA